MSNEAMYRAKLKYGHYQNPAAVSLGVDPSASDTAALLAASSDLSVEHYTRQLSADAATAALIAKGDAPVAWTRDHIAPEAELAALSAKSALYPSAKPQHELAPESNEAASFAASSLKKATSKSALQEQYDFDDVRSGKVTLSQLNNGSDYLKSLTTSKDFRHGLATSNKANEGSRVINISGITEAAKKSATKTMTNRLDPGHAVSNGLQTKSVAESVNKQPSSIYIKDIYAQSKTASQKVLAEKRPSRPYGLETPSDKGLTVNPAYFGTAALKEDLKVDYASAERATLKDNSLVDQKVYAYAADRASKTLARLSSEAATKSIFADQKMNQKAYEIAYANAKKRRDDQAHASAQIQLGGGLAMPLKDLNQLAESLVTPALNDMNVKISEMKKIDLERQQLPGQIKKREEEFKLEQEAKHRALMEKRASEKQARRDQLKLDEEELVNEHIDLKEQLALELQAKQEEVDAAIGEHTQSKQAIDDERAEKKQELDNTKEAKDNERNQELEELTGGHDEELDPILKEVDDEQAKLDELVSVRKQKQEFYDLHEERVDKAQFELDQILAKLEALEQRTTTLNGEITEIDTQLGSETEQLESSNRLLVTTGKSREAEIPELEQKLKDLKTEREGLHETLAEKRSKVDELALDHETQAKEINDIYPEHLKPEEEKFVPVNDEDLHDDKFKLDESSIKAPSVVEDEPSLPEESIWPKGFDPEPKEYVPKKKVVEEEPAPEPVKEAEQPVKEESKKVEPAPAKAKTAADVPIKSTASPETKKVPVIKSEKTNGKGLFGFFKKQKNQDYVLKTKPKPTSEVQQKFKGLQKEEPQVEAKKTEPAAKADNDDVFSGFSQGS